MGCTADELVSWLPRALPDADLQIDRENRRASAVWSEGELVLSWQTLEPRRIALLAIPRLQVCFVYRQLNDTQRYQVQKCFDLQTHRGGG